jgi:hypothetical protein
MPYINSDGSVVEQRSNLRFSILGDVFWSVINFFGLFFDTLINPQKKVPQRAYDDRRPQRTNFRGNGPKGSNIKSLPKNDCGPKG